MRQEVPIFVTYKYLGAFRVSSSNGTDSQLESQRMQPAIASGSRAFASCDHNAKLDTKMDETCRAQSSEVPTIFLCYTEHSIL